MYCCILDSTTLQELLMNGTQRVTLVKLDRLRIVGTIVNGAICLALAQLNQAYPNTVPLMAHEAVRLMSHATWRAI